MAQTQKYVGKSQIHLIEETTYGTYVNPAGDGTNMLLGTEVSYSIDSTPWVPNYVRASGQRGDPIPGTKRATISFSMPLAGSGTAGTVPYFGEALKACGLESTADPGVDVTYTPLFVFDGAGGNPGQSYSVTLVEDGPGYGISGAFGNVTFSANVGEPIMMNFTFQGAWNFIRSEGLETGANQPVYPTVAPIPFMGASMSFNANAEGAYVPLGVTNFEIDCGNQVTVRSDVNKAHGIAGANITDRSSTGSFNPEMVTVGTTDDWYEHWEEGKPCTLTTGAIGSTAGNIYTFTVNRMICQVPQRENRDGISALTIPFDITSLPTSEEGDANEPDWKLVLT